LLSLHDALPISRRDRRIIIRSPVRIRRLCPVQCEDRQGRAEQQSGDGLEIIPAAHLRLAFGAEIARSQAETRLHRVPAFGAKVGLVEDDFHCRAAPICAQYSISLGAPPVLACLLAQVTLISLGAPPVLACLLAQVTLAFEITLFGCKQARTGGAPRVWTLDSEPPYYPSAQTDSADGQRRRTAQTDSADGTTDGPRTPATELPIIKRTIL